MSSSRHRGESRQASSILRATLPQNRRCRRRRRRDRTAPRRAALAAIVPAARSRARARATFQQLSKQRSLSVRRSHTDFNL